MLPVDRALTATYGVGGLKEAWIFSKAGITGLITGKDGDILKIGLQLCDISDIGKRYAILFRLQYIESLSFSQYN